MPKASSPEHLSLSDANDAEVWSPAFPPDPALGLATLPLPIKERELPPGAKCAVLQYSHLLPALNNEVNCKILPVDCRLGFRGHF